MHLELIDWIIVAGSLIICFFPALFFGKRAGKSTAEFFASGRSVPWWLAGVSMVATTFSSDTPNLVTDIVRRNGVAGNWVWWAFVLTGVATVFFYARLWRRSGVMTDLEFYEIRYSGKAASFVRGFRSVYLGLFFNCMIMASVNLAACKIAGVLFGLDRWQTLLFVGVLNVVFATHSGLWGVLVIDMVQFIIKMTAVIAAAYFAVQLPQIGGLSGLVDKLSAVKGPGGLNYLNMLPDFTQQLGSCRSRIRHADCRAVVGGMVSGCGTGWRELYRTADACLEIRERLARRGAVLQHCALCPAPLALDPGGPLLHHCVPATERHSGSVPSPGPEPYRT